MDLFIAVLDDPESPSKIIGAFSSDEKARDACQADFYYQTGLGRQLTWQDDSAPGYDGSTYWSRLVELNERTRV
jgi:hypothetical protein